MLFVQRGLPDPGALMELEVQAGQIADSLNHLLGNMQTSLQAVSYCLWSENEFRLELVSTDHYFFFISGGSVFFSFFICV